MFSALRLGLLTRSALRLSNLINVGFGAGNLVDALVRFEFGQVRFHGILREQIGVMPQQFPVRFDVVTPRPPKPIQHRVDLVQISAVRLI